MNNDIIIYAKYDENNSIIRIISNIFLDDTEGYEEIDRWTEGQDRYLYAHADNGEYVKEKHGKHLFDELGRPNFKSNFVALTEEEKEVLYPKQEEQPSMQDQFNAMILKELTVLKLQQQDVVNTLSLTSNNFMYEIIKQYHEMSIYSDDDIKLFIMTNDISIEQYKEITGKEYE